MNLDLFDNTGAIPPRLAAWNPAVWVVDASWQPLVSDFWGQSAGRQLGDAIEARLRQGAVIYPPEPLRALALTPLPQVKVVILGQDPYHGPHQAEGLAFSVAPGVKIPPSLRNIFKEIARDAPATGSAETRRIVPGVGSGGVPASGSLIHWAQRGVLLLNTCLTVEDGQPASHAKWGWEVLTDAIIQACVAKPEPVAFLLWGAHAQTKASSIDAQNAGRETSQRHLVLRANHPSPLSALRPPEPFLGCGHFGQVRDWLALQGKTSPF